MSYPCQLTHWSVRPALAIRARTAVADLPALVDRAYGAIARYLDELGVAPAGAPYAAYFNQDMQDLDVELGFPIAQLLPSRGEIQSVTLPGGALATCLYTGPYDGLGAGYQALTDWVAAQGYAVTGVAYEFYLSDPGPTPAAELQTEIVFPLKTG